MSACAPYLFLSCGGGAEARLSLLSLKWWALRGFPLVRGEVVYRNGGGPQTVIPDSATLGVGSVTLSRWLGLSEFGLLICIMWTSSTSPLRAAHAQKRTGQALVGGASSIAVVCRFNYYYFKNIQKPPSLLMLLES